MATTQASDLFIPEVADQYTRQGFFDSLELMSGLVGTSENSPIRIMNSPVFNIEGQYVQRPKFKQISNLVTRRDVTSLAATTALKLEGANDIGVKCHSKIGPVEISKDASVLSRATPAEISQELGKKVGEQSAAYVQSFLIAALRGITSDATLAAAHQNSVWGAAARTNLSPSLINSTLNLMGDYRERFKRYARMVGRSESLNDLVDDAIGRSFPGIGDKALSGDYVNLNTLGLPWNMVDDANLTTADAGFDKYHTYIVGRDAMQVWFTKPITMYVPFLDLSKEQVLERLRGDMDFAIGANGMTWDGTTANPTKANLADGTKWSPTYTDHKQVGILEIVHNYSGN